MKGSSLGIAVAALFVAALVASATAGSLGTIVSYAAGGLVLAGALFGRLRLALIPLAIAGALAVVAIVAPSADAGEWSELIPVLLMVAGAGASLCLTLGALVRRVGRRVAQSADGSH